MATIALDIGGTKIASAIFLPDGSMLFNRKRLLKGRTGHEAVSYTHLRAHET